MILLLLVSIINAQTKPEHFQRAYASNKKICDMRIDTINNKAAYVADIIKRDSPFELEGQGNSYETLMADADYYCTMAESYAASGNIEHQTKQVIIPAEMYIYIPSKKDEMKKQLVAAYDEHALNSPLPLEKIPKIPETPVARTANVHCVPGGFVIADKSSFAYNRDCRTPKKVSMKVFGNTRQEIACAPRNSKDVDKEKYNALSMCHPMLYGVIPQKNRDGSLFAQGVCAFPEDFDSSAFNRSHNLNKFCQTMSDIAAARFMPKDPKDTRKFDAHMLEFIARTNLKNYEEWYSHSQQILKHCRETENTKEQESCVIAKKRVEAIQDEMQRLQSSPDKSADGGNIQ